MMAASKHWGAYAGPRHSTASGPSPRLSRGRQQACQAAEQAVQGSIRRGNAACRAWPMQKQGLPYGCRPALEARDHQVLPVIGKECWTLALSTAEALDAASPSRICLTLVGEQRARGEGSGHAATELTALQAAAKEGHLGSGSGMQLGQASWPGRPLWGCI